MMQITLFGPFEVQRDGRPVMGLDARKTQELLAFLLIQRSRAYSREFLAEMLWGERAPAQSKKYLRQTLWQVHSALDGPSLAGDDASLLAVEGEWVRYNERCPVALDVAQFEDAYARAVGVAGCALDAPCVDALRQAAQRRLGRGQEPRDGRSDVGVRHHTTTRSRVRWLATMGAPSPAMTMSSMRAP